MASMTNNLIHKGCHLHIGDAVSSSEEEDSDSQKDSPKKQKKDLKYQLYKTDIEIKKAMRSLQQVQGGD